MIDLVLLAGRLLLLALLYLFLLAAIRAGIGLVSGTRGRKAGAGVFTLTIAEGPGGLVGTRVPVTTAVLIGRSPGADITLGDDFVSGRHARVTPAGTEAILEDLGSTNGTLLNGQKVTSPQSLRPGDRIDIGAVRIEVDRA